ncbi:hypothetical protein CALCODRAFT_494081 [Calocera cornea HHB12733]|uniref:Uncharacterized protein n=1 Tax=Calocera cornea HHB12733 TaxID=1353952 RepID=A0A165HAY9_9BASI|nr:hypothetical protein CALCODRAFT_494081 [Calocera cornea HHB12733]
MDTPLPAPVRIQLLSAHPVPASQAAIELQAFVAQYAGRAESGDVVLGGLEKLAGALEESAGAEGGK